MKESQIAIGIDIGGSHITSAAVALDGPKILPHTTFSAKVDNKAPKDRILKNWSSAINKTLECVSMAGTVRLGFAMPGAFNYRTGLAKFEGNAKYESLYNVSIPNELPKFIETHKVDMRFLNDATAFGVGVSTLGKAKNFSQIISITLGTGFGSAFIKDGVPQVSSKGVPAGGCLWDKPYKDGMADDYFSTRWCLGRYYELSGQKVGGVKEIAQSNDGHSQTLFEEFGSHMAEFMIPYLRQYCPELIILGGNVSKASPLFLPVLRRKVKAAGIRTDFEVSDLMEDAAIMGSAKLFDSHFWEQVKDDLPEL
ncbi:ROK family protein [Pseudozobellia thermophila]|uniref:Glucokinase n=1 Tax=Pseudozobellia thermophila TaxID=192903 RepID=A0A1M6GDF3_9FLAO|nr:ROK family protein [Pseudozobellia thermophila]SHJ07942.1 glucokinase [Pseudozobellia thermophila]